MLIILPGLSRIRPITKPPVQTNGTSNGTLREKIYEQCPHNTYIYDLDVNIRDQWTIGSLTICDRFSNSLKFGLDDKNFEVEIDSKKNCPNYILSLRNTHEFRIKID